MLIPLKTEAAVDFIERVGDALKHPQTRVYFDTSFLMWITKIGSVSRLEFFEWVECIEGRAHVPSWSVQEYYRHHRKHTLKTDLTKSIDELGGAVEKFAKDMRFYSDSPLLAGQPEGAWREAFRTAGDRIKELGGFARSWDYEASAGEVITWMNGHQCDTSGAFETFKTLRSYGKSRFSHDVPPGFEDRAKKGSDSKGANTYGDLLFWEQVLAHAETVGAKHVVIVSNDRKPDWYYNIGKPDLDEALRRKKSRWEPVPMPHPSLTFEIKARTLVSQLDLLDQLYLGAIVWRKSHPKFERFANIAIDVYSSATGEFSKPAAPPAKQSQKRRDAPTIGALEASRLFDAAFALPDEAASQLLVQIEADPKTAEEQIETIDGKSLASLDKSSRVQFARQLHDRSLAANAAAQTLVAQLIRSLGELDADTAACLYLGFIVSVYFSAHAPRPRPESAFLDVIFEWQDDTAFAKILPAFDRKARKAGCDAVYLPNSGRRRVSVDVRHDTRKRATPPDLQQVYLDKRGALTDAELRPERRLRAILAGADRADVKSIVSEICRYFGVPFDCVDIAGADLTDERLIPELAGLADQPGGDDHDVESDQVTDADDDVAEPQLDEDELAAELGEEDEAE